MKLFVSLLFLLPLSLCVPVGVEQDLNFFASEGSDDADEAFLATLTDPVHLDGKTGETEGPSWAERTRENIRKASAKIAETIQEWTDDCRRGLEVLESDFKNLKNELFGTDAQVLPWVLRLRNYFRRRVQRMEPDETFGSLTPVPVPQDGWLFDVPNEFRHLTLKDAKKIMGTPKRLADKIGENLEFIEVEEETNPVDMRPVPVTYSYYENFPRCNRGPTKLPEKCNGCWAYAAGLALSLRACRVNYSVQRDWRAYFLNFNHILECSIKEAYADRNSMDGCRGGYADEALNAIAQRTAVPTMLCNNPNRVCRISVSSGTCPTIGANFPQKFVRNFSRNRDKIEERIQRDIMTNGPVVATISLVNSLFGHRGIGIYKPANGEKPMMDTAGSNLYHSVVITGWGVAMNGEKFWEVENVWGGIYLGMPSHMRGTFYMTRGINALDIEFGGVYAMAVDPSAIGPSVESEALILSNNGGRRQETSTTQSQTPAFGQRPVGTNPGRIVDDTLGLSQDVSGRRN